MTGGPARGWYVGSWPPLAWVETAVKGAAQVVGIVVLARALGDEVAWPDGVRLAELILLGVLSLGLVGAIGDRLVEREVVGMAFVISNNVAHWGLVFALATLPGPGALAAIFFALMTAGELVKLAFLATSGYRVRKVPPRVVAGLTATYATAYAVLLGLDLTA